MPPARGAGHAKRDSSSSENRPKRRMEPLEIEAVGDFVAIGLQNIFEALGQNRDLGVGALG